MKKKYRIFHTMFIIIIIVCIVGVCVQQLSLFTHHELTADPFSDTILFNLFSLRVPSRTSTACIQASLRRETSVDRDIFKC